MYVHSFSYLVNKLELGGYTYLQLKKIIINKMQKKHNDNNATQYFAMSSLECFSTDTIWSTRLNSPF